MHEWGDSGISAILLAVIVILVLSLGLVRQARAKTVRYQRIRRMVTEEARRDEAEALAEYRSMVANCNICTVCSNPSATRCSRCKAVRYCSSACQRLHWKQGHKLECRPATSVISPVTSGISPVTSSSGNGSSGSSTRAISDVSESYAQVELAKPASSITENGTLGRPKQILYPYEDFVELFYKERLQVPPCGLINCGNSCFANVVLQCLTFTRPLTAYLLEGTHGEQCRRSSDFCFMCELQDHVWRVRVSPNPLSPIRILARIRNIGNHLGYGRQEDAHEFMRFAIDSMQSICVDEAGGEKSVDPRSQETTIVHHIFGGHLQSQVICMQCLQESNRYESMMDLAVEIQGSVETLEDALLQFTAHECLDGDNKYKCDRCNAYVKATKRLTMHEAPNILTIALKRFQSGKFGKLNKRVTFPEILDVAPYMSGKGDNPPLYRLYAVVVHVDMLNASFFGHYICYVKDSEGLWYKLDDSKVKEVDLEKVMSQRAYMLLYTRGFARPPPLTDELNSSYPVEAAHKLASDISVRQGSSKVYPAPPYLREEIISERSQGLHAMVDFNQLQAEVQGNSQTVWEHSLPNGEIASPQLSGWEAERNASGSTSLDDEASTEDSGYEATSLTQTSSYISTRANNSRIVVSPPQDCVCQELDTFVEDGMDYVREDTQEQCQPSEFSEISLQPFAGDTSHNSKIGKRRLEDGLSPLPAPKPLNTDQLPAWPPGNPGISVAGPQVHTSAISACHPISEGSPSLQKHDVENTGESMPSASLSRQRMMASDHSLVGEGTSHEAGGSDLVMLETSDEGEESSLVRAKRQHVEIETGADAPTEAPRLEELSHSKEESSPELGQRDVDWDMSSLHSGSPQSLSNFEVVRPSEKGVLVDIGQYSSQREDSPELQLPHFVQWEPKGSLSAGREAIQVNVEEGFMYNKGDMPVQPASIIPPEGAYIRPGKESSVPENQQESILEAAAATTAGVDSPMSIDEVDLSPDSPAIGGLSKISGPLSNCEPQGVPNRSLRGRASKSKSKPLFAPGFLNRTQTPAAKAKAKGFRGTSTTTAAVEDKNLNQVEASGKFLPESGPPISLIEGKGDISPIDRENSEEVTCPPGKDQCCSSNGVSQPKEGEMCDPSSTSDVQQASTEVHQQLCDKYTGDSSGASHFTPPILSTHAPVQDEAPENQATNFSVNGGQERLSSKSTGATGNGKEEATQPAPPVNTNEERQPMVIDRAVPSLSKPSIGKQKQGRNETCKCGSQRKWKKCCGKAVVIKPEQGRRRLVV